MRYEAVNAMLLEKLVQHPVLMSMFLAAFVSRESAGGDENPGDCVLPAAVSPDLGKRCVCRREQSLVYQCLERVG